MKRRDISRRVVDHHPSRRARRPEIEGLESRQLLALAISEFPTQIVGGQPASITSGSDGNLWYTLPTIGAIESINPSTHAIQFFGVPNIGRMIGSITSGSDGNLWFIVGGQIESFDPRTRVFTVTAIPSGGQPHDITAGPDGRLWFTETPRDFERGFEIGAINPTTRTVTEYVAPNFAFSPHITRGPGNTLAFTSPADLIGTINASTGAVAEFQVPPHIGPRFPDQSTTITGSFNGENGIALGPDGNLWFTEYQTNRVGVVNPSTGAVADFFLPRANAYPQLITAGPDGNLYFTESGRLDFTIRGERNLLYGVSAIGMINPITHVITDFPTPTINSAPQGITVGPDGHLWFVEAQADQVGEAIIHPSDGPRITSVARFGIHSNPTSLVLTFNAPLDPLTAQNPSNYRLLGPGFQLIAIVSASYNAASHQVTLATASRLNVHRNYLLTVVGTGPHGVLGIYGDPLNGTGSAQSGSDFVMTVNRNNLVSARSLPTGPKFVHRAASARRHH